MSNENTNRWPFTFRQMPANTQTKQEKEATRAQIEAFLEENPREVIKGTVRTVRPPPLSWRGQRYNR